MAPKAAPEASNAAKTQEAPARKEAAGVMKRSSAFSIDPLAVMRREGWNPRFDFGEIEALVTSIKANGLLNAIRVKRIAPTVLGDGNGPTGAQVFNFELIDGDRRLTAVEAILKKEPGFFPDGIPAIIVDKAQEDLTSLIQMFEANSGKPFLPLEEAAAYKRMRDAGMSIKAICAAVGRRNTHVNEMLALLEAAPEVQEAVAKGEIGKTEAKQIASIAKGDAAKQRELTAVAKAANQKNGKKGSKGAVKAAMKTAHREQAEKKGRKLKIRALSDSELSAIGSDMAEYLLKVLEANDVPVDTDLVEIVRQDPKMVIAYTAGALDALKVAAGGANNLKLV